MINKDVTLKINDIFQNVSDRTIIVLDANEEQCNVMALDIKDFNGSIVNLHNFEPVSSVFAVRLKGLLDAAKPCIEPVIQNGQIELGNLLDCISLANIEKYATSKKLDEFIELLEAIVNTKTQSEIHDTRKDILDMLYSVCNNPLANYLLSLPYYQIDFPFFKEFIAPKLVQIAMLFEQYELTDILGQKPVEIATLADHYKQLLKPLELRILAHTSLIQFLPSLGVARTEKAEQLHNFLLMELAEQLKLAKNSKTK